MTRLLKFIVCICVLLTFSNCAIMNIACLEAGEGVTHKTVKTNVAGADNKYNSNSPSGYWTDSGLVIGLSDAFPMEIKGEINTCPDPNNSNIGYYSHVVVPAKFCNNNTVPDYSTGVPRCAAGFGEIGFMLIQVLKLIQENL